MTKIIINNFGKQVLSVTLAAGITLSTAACHSNKVEYVDLSALLQLEEVQNRTLIDELVISTDSQKALLEDTLQLERLLTLRDNLSRMDFRELKYSGETKIDRDVPYLTITDEKIEELKQNAKMAATTNSKQDQRKKALIELYSIDEMSKEWIDTYGKEILIRFMINSVRASVASELEISPEEFSKINILNQKSAKEKESYYIIIDKEKYEVKVSSEELWNTINYMFQLRERTKPIGKDYDIYKKGLELAKITIASGCTIKKSTIQSDKKLSYIQKKYEKKED